MKTVVLLVSKNFLSKHPRAGKPTGFAQKIKAGVKIHTIRTNFKYWEKKIRLVQEGKAVLSIRQWTGKPYRSKQKEVKRFYAKDGVGIQFIEGPVSALRVDKNKFVSYVRLAVNDGLHKDDFESWFKEPLISGAIIHFTKTRY